MSIYARVLERVRLGAGPLILGPPNSKSDEIVMSSQAARFPKLEAVVQLVLARPAPLFESISATNHEATVSERLKPRHGQGLLVNSCTCAFLGRWETLFDELSQLRCQCGLWLLTGFEPLDAMFI